MSYELGTLLNKYTNQSTNNYHVVRFQTSHEVAVIDYTYVEYSQN